ncbi:porin [Caballeronia sp. DA-9]|uniref:porin n=1 Tax=Caballeronia sp. DA-9 TaxID=3436237 RepID=UPI003F67AE50
MFVGVIPAAHAQSSATMYGIISEGIAYINNQGGGSTVAMLSGVNQNSRFGFRIREDLGSDLAAVATLENGFSITTGAFGQNGRMFGRQALVGLSSKTYGTLTAGRQYDMLWDYLDRIEPLAAGFGGFGVNVGSNDNIEGNFRYSNSVKYISPTYSNISFEALYAFSNKAGDFSQNRAYSAGIGYDDGKRRFALAYLDIDHPGLANTAGAVSDDYQGAPFQFFHTSPRSSSVGVRRQRVFGAGTQFDVGNFTVSGLFSDVRYSYLDNTSLHLDNYDLTLTYKVTPALFVSGAYLYTNGRYGGIDTSSHWNQGQLSADYFLSKRTDVFVFGNYIKGSGELARAVLFSLSPSSTKTQVAVTAGIRHKF